MDTTSAFRAGTWHGPAGQLGAQVGVQAGGQAGAQAGAQGAGSAAGPDGPSLRIDVVDYSGHPFQVQLSRSLAARGHEVRHLFCGDYSSGKGRLQVAADDPATFSVRSVSVNGAYNRYKLRSRATHEVRFGIALAREIVQRRPDVVVMCNVPLVAHAIVASRLRAARIPQVFWLQDIYSRAIRIRLRKLMGRFGTKLGGIIARVERSTGRRSQGFVVITSDFLAWTERWGVTDRPILVLPNWAPLDELVPGDRDNAWAREHDLVGRPVVLYSGTLGLKHDPNVLLRLALWAREHRPEARVVVVSEGYGRNWLTDHPATGPDLPQLVMLDFQPYDRLSEVHATADVLVAVLEHRASIFSVPSKVLSYFCAGRPILAVMPFENLASRTILAVGAGQVVSDDGEDMEKALEAMLDDPEGLAAAGLAGRAHAEKAFAIDDITSQFLGILHEVASRRVERRA